jgi:hypothetical protein
MQFVKLNKKFDVSNFTEISLRNEYAIKGKGIVFYDIINYNRDLILSVIPERYRHDFSVLEMKINYNIPPHTDSYVSASINFYVKAIDCQTNFYNKADDSLGVRMTAQTTGRTFSEENLEHSGSFIAESGDAWLLDVSSPHSVKNLSKMPVDRIALVLQSRKYNFDQVYDMLQETGYITQ